MNLFDTIRKFRDDIVASNYIEAIADGRDLLDSIFNLLSGTVGATTEAVGCGPDECVNCLQEAKAAIDVPKPKKGSAETVGKIFPGDGSFLKLLIEAFMKFLPLILNKPPTVAPPG